MLALEIHQTHTKAVPTERWTCDLVGQLPMNPKNDSFIYGRAFGGSPRATLEVEDRR